MRQTLVALALLSLVTCAGTRGQAVTADEVNGMIRAELRQGSSSRDIEDFLVKHKITYSFDRFANRYQGIIRNVSKDKKQDQAIVIYIYVDGEKKFTRQEVRDSFTAP